MAQISITIPDTAHWHALIGEAEYSAHHLLPQDIEDYLVRLFMRFERDENSSHSKCIKTDESNIDNKLQRLGDQCLLLCGFYPEASEDFGVSIEEFINMGADAYRKMATIESGEESIVYEYLASHFKQVSHLLNRIQTFSDKQIGEKKNRTENESSGFAVYYNFADQTSLNTSISHRVLN